MTSRPSSVRSLAYAYRLGSLGLSMWVFHQLAVWPIIATEADRRSLANTIAGADATLLGFLVSAGALLYAVANTRLVQNLILTGHFNRVVNDLFVAAAAFLAAVAIGFSAGLTPAVSAAGAPMFDPAFRALIAANVLAFLLLLPPAHGLWELLTNIEPEDKRLR